MTKVTAQELKERFEEAKKHPLPPTLKVTCICGNCDTNIELMDEDYEEMARILNGEPQTESKLQV